MAKGDTANNAYTQAARNSRYGRAPSILSSSFVIRHFAPLVLFVGLAALFLFQTLFTGKVLLAAENLYALPPWDRYAAQFGISVPHNQLLSDALLQNYAWKSFIRDTLASGQLPLWNPYILGGQPFLAGGQGGVLYPLSLIFLLVPVPQAYSIYTAVHLVLAGVFTFAFLRAIGANRFGAAVSGVTFAFSGFMVASFIWPMVIGVAVWLPLVLLAAEKLLCLTTDLSPVAAGFSLRVAAESSSPGIDASAGACSRRLQPARPGAEASSSPSSSPAKASTPGDEGAAAGDEPPPYGIGDRAAGQSAPPCDDKTGQGEVMDRRHLTRASAASRPAGELAPAHHSSLIAHYSSLVLWAVVFAAALGVQFLAGHMEFSGYLLATTAFYVAARLAAAVWHARAVSNQLSAFSNQASSSWATHDVRLTPGRPLFAVRRSLVALGLFCLLVAIAAALAGPQLLPFAELAGQSFRSGSVTYAQVVGWAYRPLQLLAFVMPDFFGNPTHHSYLDLLAGREVVVAANSLGEPVGEIFWGARNYVEGAAYVGILPMLLAAVALLTRRDRYTWLFALLAALSLAFAFGTPIYSLLYNWVPGYSQLHTPFRWIFPYSFAVAVLAGLGASALTRVPRPDAPHPPSGRPLPNVEALPGYPLPLGEGRRVREAGWVRVSRTAALVGGLALAAGLLVAVALGASLLLGDRAIGLAQLLLERSSALQRGFPDGRALFFYEFRNLALLATLLAASGAIVLLLLRLHRGSWLGTRDYLLASRFWLLARAAALALVVADLFFFGMGFNPASDPKLLEFTPPSVKLLREDTSLFRIASFGEGRPFIPNAPMAYGIADVRGYDSVILKSYVDVMGVIEKQEDLLSNRIDSLHDPVSLDSSLLNLLNVKYLVATREVRAPRFTKLYDGELWIYRNEAALPRAFLVPSAVEVPDERSALQLMAAPTFDPARTVVVERAGEGKIQNPEPRTQNFPLITHHSSLITSYTPNRVEITTDADAASYLVLSDTYYRGWRAAIDGADAPILKADATFRAVELAAGSHTVVFEFKPFSFQMGLFASMVAVSLILLALGAVVLLRFYPRGDDSPVQRLAKNSLFPMATSLLNRLLDMALAMYMLRILLAEGAGKYAFAVVVLGYLDILANFGLGTLLTREVARDRAAANRYLGNTLVTRLALWVVAMVVVGLLLGPLSGPLGITPDVGLAILLLVVGLLPSLVSATLSALFQAFEKFEYPAGVTVITTVFKIVLSVIVLSAGMGIVGLAAVSVAANLVTLAILFALMLAVLYRPKPEFDLRFARGMLTLSYPLMLNNLLNSLFFRMDSLMLKPIAGNEALGFYSTAYKFIDGLGVISSSFTLALFPLLSQYAQSSREMLARTFGLAIKLLLIVSLPICVGTTIIAPEIILVFGGPAFLPDSAVALQILIWFLPFSFVNGVTQYLLIAINQQRFITLSFVIATAFNLATNVLLIPRFGYVGAGITTVLSEWVLMVPFWYCVRRNLPPIPVLSLSWRPILASAVMGVEVWLLRDWSIPLAVVLAPLVYGAGLLALRSFDADEQALLRKALPWRK